MCVRVYRDKEELKALRQPTLSFRSVDRTKQALCVCLRVSVCLFALVGVCVCVAAVGTGTSTHTHMHTHTLLDAIYAAM